MVEEEETMKQEWQPIETAPKDGTKILVYCGATSIPEVFVAKWLVKSAFWIVCFTDMDCKPTHWMPLPDDPK